MDRINSKENPDEKFSVCENYFGFQESAILVENSTKWTRLQEKWQLAEEEKTDEELLNEYKSLQELPYDKRNSDNLYRNVYKTARKQLNEVGSLLDIPEEYIERKFNEFLFTDPLNLDFMKYSHEPPYKFWRCVYCFDKDWEVFADLALRFSSEAIVERFLSIQKFIQEDRMTNVCSEVMKARIQLHDLSKPNDSAS